MALRLADFPQHLQAAILRQMAKDDAAKPPEPVVTYCMATRIDNKWQRGPECKNRKVVEKLVLQLQNINPRAAYQTSIGNPPAKLVEVVRLPNRRRVQ